MAMKFRRRTAEASHPRALPAEITKDKEIFTFEAGMLLKTNKTATQCPKIGGHFCPGMHGIRSNRSKNKTIIAGNDPEFQFRDALPAPGSLFAVLRLLTAGSELQFSCFWAPDVAVALHYVYEKKHVSLIFQKSKMPDVRIYR
jgi:hypothetical protein